MYVYSHPLIHKRINRCVYIYIHKDNIYIYIYIQIYVHVCARVYMQEMLLVQNTEYVKCITKSNTCHANSFITTMAAEGIQRVVHMSRCV